MEREERLSELDAALAELDGLASGEELEELAAELEDAIFLLDCADDGEEKAGALEEIAGLAARLWQLAGGDAALARVAERLRRLCIL